MAHEDINGHKMIVTWHVYDLKVSHRDSFDITKFACWLLGIYGEELTVHRGQVHDFLGIYLDYSSPGKVRVSMIKYLSKLLEEFPELVKGGAATPHADHLFQVREEGEAKLFPEE